VKEKISLIGGDLRIINLAQMMQQDGKEIFVYGMEHSEEIMENKNIVKTKTLDEAIENANIIIGSIPFASDDNKMYATFSDKDIKIEDLIKKNNKNKKFIAGSINEKSYKLLSGSYGGVIDVMKREELVILNTIATAEGAIEVAIRNTDTILLGSKVLVLGFGRVGKVVARKFYEMCAKVTCAARRKTDLAWVRAFGYDDIDINTLGKNLIKYDIIINTVPQMIINKDLMKYMRKDVLMIDLASNPGGINREHAKELDLKLVWALALPGKVAPITSAHFIKETIYNVLSE